MAVLPMFPLGTALLPGATLPLHVFEPRYRQMVQDCLDGEPEFGVVLIERGWEVGGGDTRAMVATVARIVEVGAAPDGRYALFTVGTRRVAVNEWLIDNPYPLADVVDWPDPPPTFVLDDHIRRLGERIQELLVLATRLGSTAEPFPELPSDPSLASFRLGDIAPLGPADRYRLLIAPSVSARLDLLDAMLDDAAAVITFRLGT